MTTRGDPNPPSPEFYSDGRGWVTGFLVVHMLSANSYRYAYALWLAIFIAFILFTLFHWAGLRQGYIGAKWTKWAIRRRTWRKRTGHPISLPSNGQLLCLTFLPVVAILLCFIGPDYVSPTVKVFDLVGRATSTDYWDINTYTQFGVTYTIDKAWWTAGSRVGLIAFALFPICILFALKAPPFAIFAIQFATQLYFDKLSWLHRWTGRLIWLATAFHVGLWSVQLVKEKRPLTGVAVYNYAWLFPRFIWGWTAFGTLTLLTLLSFPFLRTPHYETFYYFHVVLAAATLVLSALHHPPVAIWCWIALGLWAAERLYRLVRWLYVNAIFSGANGHASSDQVASSMSPQEPYHFKYPPSPLHSSSASFATSSSSERGLPSMVCRYIAPPGYAHAELVSGATVRLTFISPKPISWAPGQHFLINIPSVSHFTTHPFTVASVCDEQSTSRALVFLVRCKNGWTRDLWHHVAELSYRGQAHPSGEKLPLGTKPPRAGVLFRMYVDGPFGSSVRANWGAHSTAVIVVGGSGVSFGLSILEYLCLCLAGRDGKHLGSRPSGWSSPPFSTRRVRFIWLVREFAHLQWCASTLRRCQDMMSRRTLQIDIFVTNFAPPPSAPLTPIALHTPTAVPSGGPNGLSQSTNHLSPLKNGSMADPNPSDDEVDLSYYTGEFGDEDRGPGNAHENYTVDLTDFDGDYDVVLPGEDVLNRRVGKVSKIRRANTRWKTPDHPNLSAKKERNRISAKSTDVLLTPDWASNHSHESSEPDLGRLTPVSFDDPGTMTPSSSFSHAPLVPSPLHATGGAPALKSQVSRIKTDEIVSMSRPETPVSGTLVSPISPLPSDPLVADLHPRLRVDDQELRDVSVISELARPGKPRLDRILADEVEKASGPIVVACCGPTSLNALVRKTIAMNIDPQRIKKGDRRGYISLVSEDFAY